jgi:hypothetical protein
MSSHSFYDSFTCRVMGQLIHHHVFLYVISLTRSTPVIGPSVFGLSSDKSVNLIFRRDDANG